VPRQRTILRENILDASMELLRTSGFKQFTARQIAIKMNSSTQPIYKEFKNMDDLKVGLLDYIKQYLAEEIFMVNTPQSDLTSVCKKYILFAKEEPTLFSAIFMDRELQAVELHAFSYEAIKGLLNKELNVWDDASLQELLDILWPVIHGVAMLVAQGQLVYNEEEISQKVQAIIDMTTKLWNKQVQ